MVSLELEARLDNLLATAQTETADIDLFAPITEREECPICMIPLPIKDNEIVFMPCCGKEICRGCDYKHTINEFKNNGLKHDMKCAFCCQPTPRNEIKAMKKLMKKKNPEAFIQMATRFIDGDGVMQNVTRSLEMYVRAAELGNVQAYKMIGTYYHLGNVVERDSSKVIEFFEVSAKKGSLTAHIMLAHFHGTNGNVEMCSKHSKVAANAGDQRGMDELMKLYKDELLSKDDLMQILRAFQASNNAMKSKDRVEVRKIEV